MSFLVNIFLGSSFEEFQNKPVYTLSVFKNSRKGIFQNLSPHFRLSSSTPSVPSLFLSSTAGSPFPPLFIFSSAFSFSFSLLFFDPVEASSVRQWCDAEGIAFSPQPSQFHGKFFKFFIFLFFFLSFTSSPSLFSFVVFFVCISLFAEKRKK